MKKDYNILILAGTQVRATNILSVINEINKKKPVRVYILDLDYIYFQNITESLVLYLKKKNIFFEIVDYKIGFKQIASHYNYLKRLLLLLKNSSKAIRKLKDDKIDIVLTGGDNFVERFFIDKLNILSTYIIIDGLGFRAPNFSDFFKKMISKPTLKGFFWSLKFKFKKNLLNFFLKIRRSYLVPGYPGMSNSKLIFVPGKWSKKMLIKDGIAKKKIISSGCPNYKELIKIKNIKIKRNGNISCSYMTGAYKSHGLNDLYLREIRLLLAAKKSLDKNNYNIDFKIKLHPNDNEGDFKNLGFEFSTNNLNDVYKTNDYVITFTTSTTLIESIYKNCIPVVILDGLEKSLGYDWIGLKDNIYGGFLIEKYDDFDKFFAQAKDDLFLKKQKTKDKIKYLNNFIFEDPFRSSKIIANHIIKDQIDF